MCNLFWIPVAPLPLAYWPCRPHSNRWLEVTPLNDTSACSYAAHFVCMWDLFAEILHSLLWHQIHLCHVVHVVIKAGHHSHLYNCLSSTKQWYDHPLKDAWCVRKAGHRAIAHLGCHCKGAPWVGGCCSPGGPLLSCFTTANITSLYIIARLGDSGCTGALRDCCCRLVGRPFLSTFRLYCSCPGGSDSDHMQICSGSGGCTVVLPSYPCTTYYQPGTLSTAPWRRTYYLQYP